jgi:hypothetical protein
MALLAIEMMVEWTALQSFLLGEREGGRVDFI